MHDSLIFGHLAAGLQGVSDSERARESTEKHREHNVKNSLDS